MARAAQLLRGGQPGRAGADHGHGPARLDRGRPRHDPALVEGAVDDRDLDLLDRHRVALADLQHARGLARRRAQPPGELREVVGGVQLVDRLAPAVAVDEVVPVRDQVPERAAVVAERHAALHAARALVAQALDGERVDELLVVRRALRGVALRRVDPGDLEEGSELAHYATRSRDALDSAAGFLLGQLGQRPLVVVRHDLLELRQRRVPVAQDPRGDRRLRAQVVLLDQPVQLDRVGLRDLVEADEPHVAARLEAAVVVEHVGHAAAHAGGEVAPRRPEDHRAAARHVLAAVVADALDDRARARVAHGEALAGEAAEERPAGGGAVEHRVADHDVLLGHEGGLVGRAHGEHAAGQALARVVVGVADQRQLDARRQPRAERLAGGAAQREADRLRRQPLGPVDLGDRAREQPADRAVDVADRELARDRLAVVDRVLGLLDQAPVERARQRRVLRAHAPQRRALGDLGHRQHMREVHAARLPVLDRLGGLQQVDAADQSTRCRARRSGA